jgi:hypothetical protein
MLNFGNYLKLRQFKAFTTWRSILKDEKDSMNLDHAKTLSDLLEKLIKESNDEHGQVVKLLEEYVKNTLFAT